MRHDFEFLRLFNLNAAKRRRKKNVTKCTEQTIIAFDRFEIISRQ